jgi:subtilisin family serine protease
VQGIVYATSMRPRAILAGWGGGPFSQAMYDAIAAAGAAGIPFVAIGGASGGNIDLNPVYPASYDLRNVVVVAATDHFDHLASFSSWGPNTVDLAAPGVGVLTTLGSGTIGIVSGTGVAASYVAGAFGLLAARFPTLTGEDAVRHLLSHVDVLPALAGRVRTSGRLNAYLPLANAPTAVEVPPDQALGMPAARLWWETAPGRGPEVGFAVAENVPVRLDIFDARGRFVRTLLDRSVAAGSHRIAWAGTDQAGRTVASGVYVVRLRSHVWQRSVHLPLWR